MEPRGPNGPNPLPPPSLELPSVAEASALEAQVAPVLQNLSIESAEAIERRWTLWEETTRAVGHVRQAGTEPRLLRVLQHLYLANASLNALVRGLWRAAAQGEVRWSAVAPLQGPILRLQCRIEASVQQCKAEIACDPRHRSLSP